MRRALAVITFVLLGAILTLAVSWTMAWRWPEGAWRSDVNWHRGYTHEQEHSWEIDVWRAPGRIVIARCETNWPRFDAQEFTPAPSWSGASDPPVIADSARPNRTNKQAETAYGWPLVAMKYEYDYRHMKVGFSGNLYFLDDVRGGVVLSQIDNLNHPNDWRDTLHVLPVRIIWLNFAANTALYGLALLVVWLVPRSVRRARRSRRGLCPSCGYPRGTSPVCTECGEALGSL